MSFELHITCSKDIDELHINFSDGTSSVVSKNDNDYQKPKEKQTEKYTKTKPKEEKEVRKPLDSYLDTSDEIHEINKEKIELPVIPDKTTVKIASELQNFDI